MIETLLVAGRRSAEINTPKRQSGVD